MTEYKEEWKLETREVDVNIAAGFEYRSMLDQLRADDLPRFEGRFQGASMRIPSAKSQIFSRSLPANGRVSGSALPASMSR